MLNEYRGKKCKYVIKITIVSHVIALPWLEHVEPRQVHSATTVAANSGLGWHGMHTCILLGLVFGRKSH